ncbi:hypothetical protein PHYBLDRAFT_73795 [Phycomyces blakesleeanus NRRL 1555(-)]|uniref:ISXO2-like transposase domain-containing protein n=1 Tax=Phycomyces blakesleeanus (strain ATCC 8743b / DSM 1359 / FGSC 10004 / NBRC 33097 / NRRL 1555) TaxID=763407 RepID=A0A162Z921_PHYB8|nr:hypothetical protein PHYBLDRAFT_73795 [Phycomyces blakesleeanus NRRL 1555(-)]OAD65131.1 hypothetical protein PHYBLDRAFT_73795 [Phycomyces blakesleeanus NRRL 1555(-)]|eukprot:XP_018283171.1 hypothetical protein PHYBLDRAFT_73795 [Phycomyces blakesleeanus NRRL 1555(-)]
MPNYFQPKDMSITPDFEQIHKITESKKTSVIYLKENNILYEHMSYCNEWPMTLQCHNSREKFYCKCNSRNCCNRSEMSIGKDTIFSFKKRTLNIMIYLIWCFILNYLLNKTEEATKLSKKTIVIFMAGIQKVICQDISSNDILIGGERITVEIDESKFENIELKVFGFWGVEQTSERKIFLVAVSNRTADNFLNIIQHHVLSGSIIHTDYFKLYNQLETLKYRHSTVNHSVEYKISEGVHTNIIEVLQMIISIVRQIKDNNISLEQQLLLDLDPDYETYFTENESSSSENKNAISSDSNNTSDSTDDNILYTDSILASN